VAPDAYQHHEEVADYVTAYCTQRPETCLILSGKEDILAPFRWLLSSHAQGRIIDTVPLHWRATHDHILRVTSGVLERHEHEEDRETVQPDWHRF
jgi:hypothetical protein